VPLTCKIVDVKRIILAEGQCINLINAPIKLNINPRAKIIKACFVFIVIIFFISIVFFAISGNVLLLGARCGTASRVRSAKIKFSREKKAQSQQNQAMALSKCCKQFLLTVF
jgi:hypothetical protein